ALPVRSLGGEPALAEGGDAQVRQVAQGRGEAGGGDHLVDLEGQPAAALARAPGQDPEARASPLHRLDRGIEHYHTAGQDVIFVGLEVAGAHAHQRVRVHREPGRAGRREHDLPGPGKEAARDLESRVLLADDEDPAVGIALYRLELAVVRNVGET